MTGPFDGMRPLNRAERRSIGMTGAQYRTLVFIFFRGFAQLGGHS